jgi:hypothetical protein
MLPGARPDRQAVLNEVDLKNESANYQVWLAGPQVFGQGSLGVRDSLSCLMIGRAEPHN